LQRLPSPQSFPITLQDVALTIWIDSMPRKPSFKPWRVLSWGIKYKQEQKGKEKESWRNENICKLGDLHIPWPARLHWDLEVKVTAQIQNGQSRKGSAFGEKVSQPFPCLWSGK
jgi:hypothetical protein